MTSFCGIAASPSVGDGRCRQSTVACAACTRVCLVAATTNRWWPNDDDDYGSSDDDDDGDDDDDYDNEDHNDDSHDYRPITSGWTRWRHATDNPVNEQTDNAADQCTCRPTT